MSRTQLAQLLCIALTADLGVKALLNLQEMKSTDYSHKNNAPSLGTSKVLLSEIKNLLAEKKGSIALNKDEITYVQSIHELLSQDIMPGILEGHRDAMEELHTFYQAVLDCNTDTSNDLETVGNIKAECVRFEEEHGDCRVDEEDAWQEMTKLCTDFSEYKQSIANPDEVPASSAAPEEMVEWIADAAEYYCPMWEIYEKKMIDCDKATKNYEEIRDHCNDIQDDFEREWCTYKTALENACQDASDCYGPAVNRFNERKGALELLNEQQLAEWQAAQEIECYWEWVNSTDPCIINNTQVEICADPGNESNVTMSFPDLPGPVPCDPSEANPAPCTEGWLNQRYIQLNRIDAVEQEMLNNCEECLGDIVDK